MNVPAKSSPALLVSDYTHDLQLWSREYARRSRVSRVVIGVGMVISCSFGTNRLVWRLFSERKYLNTNIVAAGCSTGVDQKMAVHQNEYTTVITLLLILIFLNVCLGPG